VARRTLAIAALTTTAAIAVVVGFAGPAQAHDALVSSTPASGDVLTALPAAFSVTMNEALVDPGTGTGTGTNFDIQITDATGRFYGDGCVSLVDATMSMPANLGAAGQYTMNWQLISADSHVVSSSSSGYSPVTFTWQPPADATPSTGFDTAPVCGQAEETPDPEMTTQAEEPAATPGATPTAVADDTTGTLLWLGGAALAVIVAIGATLLIVRPKKKE
jgi:methionine-rich copper-binding protein CopC